MKNNDCFEDDSFSYYYVGIAVDAKIVFDKYKNKSRVEVENILEAEEGLQSFEDGKYYWFIVTERLAEEGVETDIIDFDEIESIKVKLLTLFPKLLSFKMIHGQFWS